MSQSGETSGSIGEAYRGSVAVPPYQLGRALEKSLSGPEAAGFSPHLAERLIISRKRPLVITLPLPKTDANCLPAHSSECQTSSHIFNPNRKAFNVHQSQLSLYRVNVNLIATGMEYIFDFPLYVIHYQLCADVQFPGLATSMPSLSCGPTLCSG